MIALAAILAVTGGTVSLGLYGVRLARTTSDLDAHLVGRTHTARNVREPYAVCVSAGYRTTAITKPSYPLLPTV